MGSDGAQPRGFSLDVGSDGEGRTTVAPSGELDLANVDEFSAAISSGLDSGPVVIDLARLSFMDSAGVRALNQALRAAAERGHELLVAAELQTNVRQVLELTGMLGLLPMRADA